MSLPNVLIIGSMKAGTTSLYMDLTSHPQMFRAESKEPHSLCEDEVLTEKGRAAYGALYAKVRPGQLIVDASSGYAKRPDFGNVAARAVEVLPAGFKIVYAVRHPIQRIVSQHHHEHTAGTVGVNIDEEVRRLPHFVDYSRYAYQLEPWLEAVGIERIHVVKFEDYVDCRAEVLERLCGFLGLDSNLLAVEEDKVYNKTSGKPVRNRFWHVVFHNPAYRRFIRPVLSPRFRLTLMQWLLPKGSLRPGDPTPETVEWLRGKLGDDVAKLRELLKSEKPLWEDFAAPTDSVMRSSLAT